MFVEENNFVVACARHGLVLDANMLTVYIVGHINPERMQDFNITHEYDCKDYQMIKHYIECSRGKKAITTPYVISEISHLLGIEPNRSKKGKPLNKPEAFDKAIAVLSFLSEFTETNVRAMAKKYGTNSLVRFGIPDVSLVEAVNEKAAFLSSDSQLCDEMSSRGLPALHYSRARVYYNKLSLNKILGT